MKTLGKFIDQFSENAAKQPGWVPLLVLVYLALPLAGLPGTITVGGRPVALSREVVAGVVTLFLFLLGDSFDKAAYKPLETLFRAFVEDARATARRTVLVHDGIYDVMKKLALAAGRFQTFSIQFLNEVAKFFRSLILPFLGAAVGLALSRRLGSALALALLSVLLTYLYVQLKAAHMRHLYQLAPELTAKPECSIEDAGRARMFFWDGLFVTSAIRAQPAG